MSISAHSASARLVAGFSTYGTAADAAAPASALAPGTTPVLPATPLISEATAAAVPSFLGGAALSFATSK